MPREGLALCLAPRCSQFAELLLLYFLLTPSPGPPRAVFESLESRTHDILCLQ